MPKGKNILEMKPIRKNSIEWNKKEENIEIIIKRDKLIDKVLHWLYKTPRIITIDLDEIGSFVWERCDGSCSIHEILLKLTEKYNENIESGLNRLIQYIKILKCNSLIELE